VSVFLIPANLFVASSLASHSCAIALCAASAKQLFHPELASGHFIFCAHGNICLNRDFTDFFDWPDFKKSILLKQNLCYHIAMRGVLATHFYSIASGDNAHVPHISLESFHL